MELEKTIGVYAFLMLRNSPQAPIDVDWNLTICYNIIMQLVKRTVLVLPIKLYDIPPGMFVSISPVSFFDNIKATPHWTSAESYIGRVYF